MIGTFNNMQNFGNVGYNQQTYGYTYPYNNIYGYPIQNQMYYGYPNQIQNNNYGYYTQMNNQYPNNFQMQNIYGYGYPYQNNYYNGYGYQQYNVNQIKNTYKSVYSQVLPSKSEEDIEVFVCTEFGLPISYNNNNNNMYDAEKMEEIENINLYNKLYRISIFSETYPDAIQYSQQYIRHIQGKNAMVNKLNEFKDKYESKGFSYFINHGIYEQQYDERMDRVKQERYNLKNRYDSRALKDIINGNNNNPWLSLSNYDKSKGFSSYLTEEQKTRHLPPDLMARAEERRRRFFDSIGKR